MSSAFKYALALAQKLVATKPENAEWAERLGAAHNNLGKIALMRGDLATAIREYAADDRIEADLSARDPRNNDQRRNVFRVRAILGRTWALVGETDVAIRALRDAVDIAEQLKQLDPTITPLQENSALYQMQLSRLLRLGGNLSEAVELTNRSLETFVKLTQQDPGNASWQRELAEVLTEHSAQLLASGQNEKARKAVDDALSWLNPALDKRPDDRSTILATLNARMLAAGFPGAPAPSNIRESCLTAIEAVKSGADDPRLIALKVSALLGLGRMDEAQGEIAVLRKGGYRDPQFVDELRLARIDYPPETEFQQKVRMAVAEIQSKGASPN